MLLEQGVPQSSCKADSPRVPDSKHRAYPWNSICCGIYDAPQLAESGDEFIQNIPVYVEESAVVADVVQFAAKYNIVLPEYVIDSDLLIEKVTALISDEKSGILTVDMGRGQPLSCRFL